MAIILERMDLEAWNFFWKIGHEELLKMRLGVFQNLDQGPGGVLKTVFFKYGFNFGTDGPRDLKFVLEDRTWKILGNCYGVFQNIDQGPGVVFKIVFFWIMAKTLERMIIDTWFFLKTGNEKILDTCLGVFQNLDQGWTWKTVFF